MSTEDKFNAAVNVIRSLPKNGSYQPSNELLLRFYAYFKQATQGPCKGPKPAFWDVVGKAKYNAWCKLGDMSKHEAMKNYVAELHRIVETMSYTDNVANFLEAQAELDNVPMADLEMVAGDVIERVRSQPNSPFASREASPQRVRSSLETSPASSLYSHSPDPQDDTDHSDEEYIDTVESAPETGRKAMMNGHISENIPNGVNGYGPKETMTNGHGPKDNLPNGHGPKETNRSSRSTKIKSNNINSSTNDATSNNSYHVDISQEISKTVQSLKADLDRLSNRINNLEKNSSNSAMTKYNKYISFSNISPSLLAFLILWPFITHSALRYWSNRK